MELIVRRPAVDLREVLERAQLDSEQGLIGDNWGRKPSSRTPDRSPHPDMQITLMDARVLESIEPDRSRWPLAGDQFYVNFDLSPANLPAGSRLRLGEALLQVTEQPHTGCAKFSQRFGVEALKWVNGKEGRSLNRRGINARVVRGGWVQVGDVLQVEA